MRLSLSGLLAACVVLAVAGALAKVLALLIIVAMLAAIITRPRETLALVATVVVLNLVALHPLATVGIIGSLAAGKMYVRWRSLGQRGMRGTADVARISDESQRG